MRTRPDDTGSLAYLEYMGYGLFGRCADCSALHRKDVPCGQHVLAYFDIDLYEVITERSADASYIRMDPFPCSRCGGRNTEYRLTCPNPASRF